MHNLLQPLAIKLAIMYTSGQLYEAAENEDP